MLLTLVHIGPKSTLGKEFESLTQLYLQRTGPYAECHAEGFKTEAAFLEWFDRLHGRTRSICVLLDSRGRQFTSEAFAAWIAARRDQGEQRFVFAIGPADGWSGEARAKAQLLLSLGQWTLPHALARLVMAEQLYRACTILAGHPYHTGH